MYIFLVFYLNFTALLVLRQSVPGNVHTLRNDNIGCFKKSFTMVFQMLLCGEWRTEATELLLTIPDLTVSIRAWIPLRRAGQAFRITFQTGGLVSLHCSHLLQDAN
jgi:hypothetical protein